MNDKINQAHKAFLQAKQAYETAREQHLNPKEYSEKCVAMEEASLEFQRACATSRDATPEEVEAAVRTIHDKSITDHETLRQALVVLSCAHNSRLVHDMINKVYGDGKDV